MENTENQQKTDAALSEIERTLGQMLALAQLSASELNMDRAALQRTLERLQNKIDRIADGLAEGSPPAGGKDGEYGH